MRKQDRAEEEIMGYNKYSIRKRFIAESHALRNAIDRCTRTNHPQFHRYGGRGIQVHPDFLDPVMGFINFLAEVGPKPSPELSLDRKNNDMGYMPGNLKWSSRLEQQSNRKAGVDVTEDFGWGKRKVVYRGKNNTTRMRWSPLLPVHEGKSLTVLEWARELGISPSTIRQRVRRGWPIDLVLARRTFVPNSTETKKLAKRMEVQ